MEAALFTLQTCSQRDPRGGLSCANFFNDDWNASQSHEQDARRTRSCWCRTLAHLRTRSCYTSSSCLLWWNVLFAHLGSAFCLQTSAQAETFKLLSNPFNPSLTGKSLVLMDKGCLELQRLHFQTWFLSAPYQQQTHEASVALKSKF